MPTAFPLHRDAVSDRRVQNDAVMPGERSTRARLLVATPPLGDENFDRSVIYMLDHNEDGAVGLVLNRPTPETEVDGLEEWGSVLSPPARIFSGGPVERDSLIALGTAEGRNDDAWGLLDGQIGTVDLSMRPQDVATRVGRLRIFRGYAGWSSGQLDAEVSLGAWMVFDATEDDLFTSEPHELWRRVIPPQGGRLAWIADAPEDLSAN
jgi:putative transcriptional regulator